MPLLPFQILLGLLGIFFAHFAGRSGVRLSRGQATRSRFITWLLRTIVCLYAVFWFGGLGWIAGLILGLAAGSLAWGAFDEWRPKRQPEDLSKTMFPPE